MAVTLTRPVKRMRANEKQNIGLPGIKLQMKAVACGEGHCLTDEFPSHDLAPHPLSFHSPSHSPITQTQQEVRDLAGGTL